MKFFFDENFPKASKELPSWVEGMGVSRYLNFFAFILRY